LAEDAAKMAAGDENEEAAEEAADGAAENVGLLVETVAQENGGE
jgi:hypothetical protein